MSYEMTNNNSSGRTWMAYLGYQQSVCHIKYICFTLAACPLSNLARLGHTPRPACCCGLVWRGWAAAPAGAA